MAEPRSPRDVPDDPGAVPSSTTPFVPDVDTDGDGHPDTAVGDDGVDLVLATDLDGDGLPDQIVRIGPDGIARLTAPAGLPGLPGLPAPTGWTASHEHPGVVPDQHA